ncbi:MAG: PAS domain S-box protein [Planctomycetes bacterium]|nr:PAS domain S-box protein [Planctomycetota bacterium]
MQADDFVKAISGLDFPGVVIVAVGPEGKIRGVNPFGRTLVGKSVEELSGRPWQEFFVAPAQHGIAARLLADSRAPDAAHARVFESFVVTTTGNRRLISWHPASLPDELGGGFVCLGEDVTTRDRAQHDLLASDQRMRAIVENAVEGIVTISEAGIVQTVNSAACRLFGYEASEMLGRNVSMLMPSPDREQHDGYLQRYMQTGVAGIIGLGREVIALRKNGERFPIYLSVSDLKGEPRMFTGVVRDLSEQKRMQKQLQEQEALAAIGKMAAVVAHEVKNPLAGIAGVIQVLRGRLPQEAKERQIMGEVLSRIDSLVETLQDLLFYARPRELKFTDVALKDLLDETVRLLIADPRAQDVRVTLPDSRCRLQIDVAYLREALLNIYLNAAQAMNGKGEIRTELEDAEGRCILRIADSGPGMPEAVRRRVFEPFFTTKGRGTGLGLALVKRVVERHGGEVSIECPEGGGTVVTLKLPHRGGGD